MSERGSVRLGNPFNLKNVLKIASRPMLTRFLRAGYQSALLIPSRGRHSACGDFSSPLPPNPILFECHPNGQPVFQISNPYKSRSDAMVSFAALP